MSFRATSQVLKLVFRLGVQWFENAAIVRTVDRKDDEVMADE